ncbi:3-isopropylmalate dehydratase [Arthrobacter sp. SRS-W-1-2016]|uniref:LeuD/DmdB family oxidoreductase small subunit n=1 Tax=Arthrobacter sp. SRS-W-1-2016 TaxID=1930254 RepID=UPI0009914E7C|nr:3-isopropylmalate dehydratase [Arthrobacter sp. SRS-W-1-2016]OOP63083.1 3-isopropylmalate dehydratase [Arthrobacter sp. SRS-W-1-2016]
MTAETRSLQLRGRIWIFGDDINTDDMYPGFAMRLPVKEAARHVFHASRPDWPALVQPGDIIVGGRRFGLGSARPVALLLLELGVSCILAEQFNSLFLRNIINYGLPILAVPGVSTAFTEGEIVDVDIESARVQGESTGTELRGKAYPPLVVDLLRHGGVAGSLRSRGYLD